MVIDTSAVLAILLDEPERRRFDEVIEFHARRLISAGTLLESAIVIESRRGEIGRRALDAFLRESQFEIVPVDSDQVAIARAGFRKYGKGRHRASLNFGDCFAYALAKATGEPLLFKGSDFERTEIKPASAGYQ
jgi:ribonuclease VapC